MSNTITDPRFAKIQTDPRYRLPSKKRAKIQLDSRFSRMLKDDDFLQKARVDRYGRPVEKHRGKRDLERFYQVAEDEEDDDGDSDDAQDTRPRSITSKAKTAARVEDESGEDDEVVSRELKRIARGENYDPARDGGFSTSESESSSEEEDEDEAEAEEAEALEPSAEIPTGEVTTRLALVNMDWDNLRAIDLMAVASSFTPRNGSVLSVTVYPSEFGRQRMEREALEGPPAEVFRTGKSATTGQETRTHEEEEDDSNDNYDDENSEQELQMGDDYESDIDSSDPEDDAKLKASLLQDSEAVDFNPTALRRYQLDRLRYYYAVISCSSKETAKTLYDNMDGREYLSSANFFDLRFIPDDTSFDEDQPRDTCDKVPGNYRPSEFVTDALQHSKVKLTWDADDKERKDAQEKAFQRGKMTKEEAEYDDLAAYIGSGSDEDEDEEDDLAEEAPTAARFGLDIPVADTEADKANKPASQKDRAAALRAALGLNGTAPTKSKRQRDEAPMGNMEITFSAGLTDETPRQSVFVNEPDETTQEKYIRKERERKARRKEKAKAAKGGVADDATADAKTEVSVNGGATSSGDKEVARGKADEGFEDSFFADPQEANRKAARDARKADKERARREREEELAASSKQRAELELLLNGDGGGADADGGGLGNGVRHFNMNEIIKREKEERRKGKGKRSKKAKGDGDGSDGKGGAVVGEEDGFVIPVDDPRFARLYDSHEFAIDPSDARFKGTKAMKALLDEGRKRRRGRDGEDLGGDAHDGEGRKKKKVKNDGWERGAEDIQSLVAKVKRKEMAR